MTFETKEKPMPYTECGICSLGITPNTMSTFNTKVPFSMYGMRVFRSQAITSRYVYVSVGLCN